jgi:hypothetical protein
MDVSVQFHVHRSSVDAVEKINFDIPVIEPGASSS